jgi:hypothetical protein
MKEIFLDHVFSALRLVSQFRQEMMVGRSRFSLLELKRGERADI